MQTLIERVSQNLNLKKQQAIDAYLIKRQPMVFFESYGAALEQSLVTLWQELFADASLCLLATGGFGRSEMYPYSDLDLAIVSPNSLSEALQEKVAVLVQTLWDMQLTPAIKVGSLEELCESARKDITADSAFLESRYLVGNHTLANQLLDKLSLQRDVASFIERKIQEMQLRHAKAQGSGSQLEPNIKTCPGGLRDIHTMLWLAKAQGLDTDVIALIQKRIITRIEASLLLNSHKQLAKIRIDLHLTANRAENRLIFDLQTQVAYSMGLKDDQKQIKSEKLMRTLYRATKTVKQLNGILIPMLQGKMYSRLPRVAHTIDKDYYYIGNAIAVTDKLIFTKNPEHIFKIIEFIQSRNAITTIAPKTLRAWWGASQRINREFYENPVNRQRFIQFFKRGAGLTNTLRFLNLYGLLGHYLPAWGKIVGLLQHDLFHVYPVDDHILMVVRNVRRLAIDAHSHELPFASSLMDSFEKKHILYLAALFHDIAKGRGGNHAIEGVTDARQFATDHFLSSEETDLLCWLVEDHLLMSITAQKEDIQDPAVVSRFCEKIQTQERLIALYLLTISDIRGTNPKIWTSWKATLLQNLFNSAHRHLSGEEHSLATLTSNRQQLALDMLNKQGVPPAQQRKLWHILGPAYFVRHELDQILWHLSEIINDFEQPIMRTRYISDTKTLEIMVFMPNIPRSFAGLSRIFSYNNLDILTARAYVTEHNYILDTFMVQIPAQYSSNDYARLRLKLEDELERYIAGEPPPDGDEAYHLNSRRSRYMPISPSIVLSSDDELPGWYILELVAVNRPFLLADITAVFSDLDISLRHANISTLDERVEDSFLLFSESLESPSKQFKLKRALYDVLNS